MRQSEECLLTPEEQGRIDFECGNNVKAGMPEEYYEAYSALYQQSANDDNRTGDE